jgi:signal transduction histidine kinase
MPSRPVIPAQLQDAAIALAVALLGLGSGFGFGRNGHVPPLGAAELTAMGLALYPRRRYPGAVLAVIAALVVALQIQHTSLEAAFIAVLVASYSAALHGTARLARTLLILAPVAIAGIGIGEALGTDAWLRAHSPIPTILAASGAWLVGLLVRGQFAARAEHIAALAEHAELESARAERATLAERIRIARELHDIVAHHVSIVVILAEGAQRMVDKDLPRAREAMAEVERTGRTALDEMRRLLGLLGVSTPYTPAFGLADVDDLAERSRLPGTLDVSLVRRGEARDVPADVGLTVYRVVQESLTNVLKHAGPATVTVELEFTPADLQVTVTDDGHGATAALGGLPGAGRGTTGMRERVTAAGGTLSTGPKPGGGYRVQARIPV